LVPSQEHPFSAVWGTSAHDVFGVSVFGITHWDGTAWSTWTDPTAAGLNDIWGSGPNDMWAVGSLAVFHWDGIKWSISTYGFDLSDSGVTGPSSLGVWGTGPNDVFVVGHDIAGASFVEHWDGAIWSNMVVPPFINASAIWGSGSDDVYVTGDARSSGAMHWDGHQWDVVQIANGFAALGISGTGAQDVWAVGDSGTFHWDGQAWTEVPRAPSGSKVWARGFYDVFIASNSGVSHWNGVVWSTVFDGAVSDIYGDQPDDTYFVGDGVLSPGTAEWFPLAALDGPLCGVGDEVVTASFEGDFVARFRPDGWFDEIPPSPYVTNFRVLWMSGRDDIWSLDEFSQSLLHWDGSAWSSTTPHTAAGDLVSFADIGGSGPNDIWAVGSATAHWDGKSWSTPTLVAKTLNHVWARGPADAYAVGDGGSLVHWDGAKWSAVASGTTWPLLDVWGTGPHDTFVVGQNGTLLHSAGGDWSPVDVHTSDPLVRISGSGLGNIYIVSRGTDHDELLHFRSGGWEPLALPAGVSVINSIWATPKSLYLTGASPTGMSFRLALNGVDCVSPEVSCDDGWDNDCDGLQDDADPDCAGKASVAEQCANLADDDGDGLVDCADPDCANFPSCRTTTGN
jgi:hypothetical protein